MTASLALTRTAVNDRAVSFEAVANTLHPELKCSQTQAVGYAPPVKLGPVAAWRANGVAQAPGEGELPAAAKWSIQVPSGTMNGVDEMFLEVRYQGDMARLYAEHRLLDDDFYNGIPWRIGLRRFLDGNGAGNFELSVLPLRKDAPVYFENPVPPVYGENGQIGKIDSLRLIPYYQLVLDASRP
jgi:hypothetical protein